MAREPVTVQPSPATTATTPPKPVTAAAGRAALEGFGDTRLLAQAEVYARGNGLGGYGSAAFWRHLPPEVAQAVLNGRYEATKAFFETWGRSIAENSEANKRVSQRVMQQAQVRAREELNAVLANEGQRRRA
ncbi:MAG: hypothetical protein ACAI38_04245 [Myxococcota bacterium]